MSRKSQDLEQRLVDYQKNASRRYRIGSANGRTTRNKWARFAAGGAAFLASPAMSHAAIVHVVPPSPIVVDIDSRLAQLIDLDNDGVREFAFGAGHHVTGPVLHIFYGIAEGHNGGRIVGGGGILPGGKGLVRRYSLGNAISPFHAGSGAVLRTSLTAGGITQASQGEWGVNDSAYAGIQLSSSRAGWIKIRTHPQGNRLDHVELLAWAYQTVPNTPIQAGDTGGGVAVTGDYNSNGSVGQEDYNMWRNRFGRNATPPGSGADGNRDGRVNAADYTLWRNQAASGVGAGTESTQIPEPGAVTLGVLALGGAGIAALRRRTD